MLKRAKVVVPYYNDEQLEAFLSQWGARTGDSRLILQKDNTLAGCAATKNAGISRAMSEGASVVIVLDDDCGPATIGQTLDSFIEHHLRNLATVADVPMFRRVTDPPSRGTPYKCHTMQMPVAASIGFWTGVGDYDAASQLVNGATKPMKFCTEPIHGQYFPLCGMNIAFDPHFWHPWCRFIDVPRFDDIWAGWLWQKEAYRRGYCFRLDGPLVHHCRQSNVWENLKTEAKHLERNETLWREIAQSLAHDYDTLTLLLPKR